MSLPEKPSQCNIVAHLDDEAVIMAASESTMMAFWVVYPLFETSEGGMVYQLKDAPGQPDPTTDIDQAECLMRGTIKWDGCMDLMLGDSRGSIHFCGRHSALIFDRAIRAVFEIAEQRMSKFSPLDAV